MKERIIQIIGNGMERERAECMADQIIGLNAEFISAIRTALQYSDIEKALAIIEMFHISPNPMARYYSIREKEKVASIIDGIAQRIIQCQLGCYLNSENGIERGDVDWGQVRDEWVDYLWDELTPLKSEAK